MLKNLAAFAGLLALVSASPTPQKLDTRSTTFWYPNMDHTGSYRGYAPNLDGDYNYPVYQAVVAGDGASIQTAINSSTTAGSTRHGMWLNSQPRVVYIPPGTYEISSVIHMGTDTILIGDPTNPPIIKASASWTGSDPTLISGQDPTTGIEGENSFAVGLKNLILDTTSIPGGTAFTALWWGVAQACQLSNIKITMAYSVNGAGHSGIRLGRGSTIALSDVRIEHGQNGIWHNGHQQALYKSIYFYQNTVGMLIDGGNTISLMAPTFDTCGTGVSHVGGVPWISIVDGKSINSGITFLSNGYPSVLIENLTKDTSAAIAVISGTTYLASQSHTNTFTYANTVGGNPIYGPVTSTNTRPATLAPGGYYPVLPVPNYSTNTVADFINIKDPSQNGGHTVLGDNTIDESAVLNAVLAYAATNNKIAYFPFGLYRVDSTLLIPQNSRIVGEAWSTITGNGAFFKNSASPQPVVKVGNAGDVGIAQIQDMRFTVSDVLPGAIILQFNMAGNNPGDVAIWNSLVTVGGTRGASALTNTCTNSAAECQAAFIGIHFAPTSSAYLENVWNWVADHITESFSGGSNIAGHGGVLIESTKATWIQGLGSEHWWLYQLNIRNANNVFISLLQSETNYDQGDNTKQIAPAPWTANVATWGDPDFSWCSGGDTRCRMGLANYFNGGSNIYTYASASWAFFSGPGYQACAAGTNTCQNVQHWIQTLPSNFQAFGLCTKDTWAGLRLADGTDIVTANGFTGSWSGDVGRYTPN